MRRESDEELILPTGKKSLYLETLDADRLKKIKELEAYEPPKKEEEALVLKRPEFITPLNRQG